jgi:hypothetical protein
VELSERHPIFVGTKMDSSLKRRIEALTGADRRYVSADDSTFLRICTLRGDEYIGKVLHEKLSTDRVDDVRRNVLSILQRLCPDTRFPNHLDILPCEPGEATAHTTTG